MVFLIDPNHEAIVWRSRHTGQLWKCDVAINKVCKHNYVLDNIYHDVPPGEKVPTTQIQDWIVANSIIED